MYNMRKTAFLFVILITVIVSFAGINNTNNSYKSIINNDDSLKICPVSGEKIQVGKGIVFKYLGNDYTFCCPDCLEEFKSEPMNYIKEVLYCPVMNEPAEKELFTMYNDTKYYFCCKPCIKKFLKEPEKYLNNDNS